MRLLQMLLDPRFVLWHHTRWIELFSTEQGHLFATTVCLGLTTLVRLAMGMGIVVMQLDWVDMMMTHSLQSEEECNSTVGSRPGATFVAIFVLFSLLLVRMDWDNYLELSVHIWREHEKVSSSSSSPSPSPKNVDHLVNLRQWVEWVYALRLLSPIAQSLVLLTIIFPFLSNTVFVHWVLFASSSLLFAHQASILVYATKHAEAALAARLCVHS